MLAQPEILDRSELETARNILRCTDVSERIKVEVVHAFGLKNKTEVWKAETILRNLRKQSRDLQARLRSGDAQAKIEADTLLAKCGRLGYLPVGADLNDILALKDENVLSGRNEVEKSTFT